MSDDMAVEAFRDFFEIVARKKFIERLTNQTVFGCGCGFLVSMMDNEDKKMQKNEEGGQKPTFVEIYTKTLISGYIITVLPFEFVNVCYYGEKISGVHLEFLFHAFGFGSAVYASRLIFR